MTFNMKRKAGYDPSKAKGPAEPVKLKVFLDQKVAAILPYLTPRAPEIRAAVNLKVLNAEGKRIFFFNPNAPNDSELKWTNVSLESTAGNPLLAAPPAIAIEVAHKVLSKCKAVSTITIVDENEQPLTVQQVCSLAFPTRRVSEREALW